MKRRLLPVAALPVVAAALLGASLAAAQDDPQEGPLVPAWIRTLAAAWSGGDISDAEFVAAVGFLVNEGIIPLADQHVQDGEAGGQHVQDGEAGGQHVQDGEAGESPVYDHKHALHSVQGNVTYAENYVHYAHHHDPVADIMAPDDKDKCFDRFGNVRSPSLKLKFKNNEYIRTLIDITGAGAHVDPENEKRPLWYQIFNGTHSVSPVYYIRAQATGLQIDDVIWIYHMQIGESYEIRSVYGDQCGRSTMMLGY